MQELSEYINLTEAFGNVINGGIACYLFIIILKKEEIVNFLADEYFWFANGLLSYCLGTTVVYVFYQTLSKVNLYNNVNTFRAINTSLVVLFYGLL
ncbi:MAG TPA: hypothetical protein VHB48_15990, partial [Chitinophagaceae bacterium]|nr:hypothetical protein [Chitinophagaceae bacterium]